MVWFIISCVVTVFLLLLWITDERHSLVPSMVYPCLFFVGVYATLILGRLTFN